MAVCWHAGAPTREVAQARSDTLRPGLLAAWLQDGTTVLHLGEGKALVKAPVVVQLMEDGEWGVVRGWDAAAVMSYMYPVYCNSG
jgi:hypothetical protein